MDEYQSELWKKAAALGDYRPVLDEKDLVGRKNRYIDLCHKLWLGKALKSKNHDRALDLGCGIGRITSWLAAEFKSVDGIDATEEMVRQASALNARPNVTYRSYDGQKFPFEDSVFDVATSVYVLQHLIDKEDFLGAVKEIRRVLKDAGSACLVERVAAQEMPEPGMPSSFVLLRTEKSYIDAFESAGFALETAKRIRSSSTMARLAECKTVPEGLFPLLTRFDAAASSNSELSGEKYADCLFVFNKIAG